MRARDWAAAAMAAFGLASWALSNKMANDLEKILEASGLLTDPDPDEWGWLMDLDEDAIGQPLWVPMDVAEQAQEILNAETHEQQEQMEQEQWRWVVNAMAVRNIMLVARAEPDLEMALMMWMASMGLPETGDET